MLRFAIVLSVLALAACQGARPKAPFQAAPAPAEYVPPAKPKADVDTGKAAPEPAKKAEVDPAAAKKVAEGGYVEHIHGADTYPCDGHPMCNKPSPKDGTLYTVGGGAEFIDPGKLSETEGFFLVENLFEGLVKKDIGGKPVGGVAESWTTSPDGTVWTFKLRHDAKWTNGRTVTAEDFRYSWLRKMSKELASTSAEHLYEFIKNGHKYFTGEITDPAQVGIKVIDDFTLEVTLEQPTPFWMEYLKGAHYYPVPKEAVEKYGAKWTEPANIVSNGAYKLVKRVHRGDIVMEKNEQYWNAKNVRIPRVHVYFSDNEEQAWQRYLDNQIQWFRNPVPTDRFETLLQDKRPDLIVDPYNCYYYYGFRTDKVPFDRPEIRRAFNMAIDKERLVKHVTRQMQLPADGAVTPFVVAMTQYPRPTGEAFNPEEARRLLAEAGYPNGQGFPPVELMYNTFESHRKIAEFVQRQIKENLNVKITLNNMEWKSLLKKLRSGDFQMSRFGWCAINDPFGFLKPFKSESANNNVAYKNAEFDKLIDLSLKTAKHAERMKVLAKAESLLQRDMPVAPLYYYTRAFLKLPVLRGFKAELGNTHLIEYMYWGDKEYDSK